MPLTLTPPDRKVTDFDLRYDVILEQLVTHRAIATIRTEWDKGTTRHHPVTLGVFDWTTESLEVHADGGSWLRGFTATVGLGVQHIGEGADHLLFLLMLLVPAPLVARGGRWRRREDARAGALRVVHVVTAFAVGHSITLGAGHARCRAPAVRAGGEPHRAVDPRVGGARPAAAHARAARR